MSLRVGHIDYLNCVPFFHYLSSCGFAGEIIRGVPTELNAMLDQGALDVSPSSSFEYGLHAEKYLLLPGHSISSIGAVQSVLLFSPLGFDQIVKAPIFVTGESATSVNLLKVLLFELTGADSLDLHKSDLPLEQRAEKGQSVLVIGDRALRMRQKSHASVQIYDLGELWAQLTGLPFVFALWILRRDMAQTHRQDFLQLARAVESSRSRALSNLEAVAVNYLGEPWRQPGMLVEYWQRVSYDLTERHIRGLDHFFKLGITN